MRIITGHDFDWSISRIQRHLFTDLWPHGAEATLENARKAQRAGLSLRCAARNLLRGKRLARFQGAASEALQTYREAIRPLIQEENRLWKRGDQAASQEAEARLREEKRQRWPEYQEIVAAALVTALSK